MKNYLIMRGLMAGKRKNYAAGDFVQGGSQPYYDPTMAGVQNVVGGPGASSVGLAPYQGTQMNVQPGISSALAGLGSIAGQGADAYKQGLGTQSGLTSTLQGEVAGTGPNPAKALLAQATGANVANQAALAAGVRGASANPGLVARQAAMAGAGAQQSAAGQAASLTAEQQLAAQQQLAGLAANEVAQGQTANVNAFNANLGQQNANITAQNQTAGARSYLGGVNQGAGAAKAIQSQPSNPGFTPSATYASNQAPVAGGIYATGGQVGPKSFIGQHIERMAKGGRVPALVSPGEIYLNPMEAKKVATGKMSPSKGEKIPGKAKVSGDSTKNDTVKKTLKEGGVVIPRTRVNNKPADFVRAVMSKHRSH